MDESADYTDYKTHNRQHLEGNGIRWTDKQFFLRNLWMFISFRASDI